MEYDRQAARRTHVVDDQSDFYAVDSNAWLSTEVHPVSDPDAGICFKALACSLQAEALKQGVKVLPAYKSQCKLDLCRVQISYW